MAQDTTQRGTCWSITWFPQSQLDEESAKREIEQYANRQLPPGWTIQGQMERCPDTGRYHYQAMVKTPQVRWSALKSMMLNAHIELGRNKVALARYTEKEESRIATIESRPAIPTLFEYQDTIANRWNNDEFATYREDMYQACKGDEDAIAMRYVDKLVARDIEAGQRGVEYIAVNPMWRSAWKTFWRSIIKRNALSSAPGLPEEARCSEAAAPLSQDDAEVSDLH